MSKYFYKDGERFQNDKCRCPREDKSQCFKIFSVWNDRKGREHSGWRIECPYFKGISDDVVSRLNKVLK